MRTTETVFLSGNLSNVLNLNFSTFRGPKFELIATATLTLADASDLPHTHDLNLIPNYATGNNNMNNNNQLNNKLPLFGHFCCRLAVQPDFIKANYCAGKLQLLSPPPPPQPPTTGSSGGGHQQLHEVYARLQAFRMPYWDSLEAFEMNEEPKHSIEVTRDTKVKRRGDYEFVLCNMEEGAIKKYIFRTADPMETSNWELALKRAVREHLLWKHITLSSPMQLTTPGTERNYFSRSGRHGSLYDQVPILRMYSLLVSLAF